MVPCCVGRALEWRRLRVGRAAIAWLRDNPWGGASRLRVEVLVWNEQALAFWRSVGFEDCAVTMELELELEQADGSSRHALGGVLWT